LTRTIISSFSRFKGVASGLFFEQVVVFEQEAIFSGKSRLDLEDINR